MLQKVIGSDLTNYIKIVCSCVAAGALKPFQNILSLNIWRCVIKLHKYVKKIAIIADKMTHC